jgi:hypothetical protein
VFCFATLMVGKEKKVGEIILDTLALFAFILGAMSVVFDVEDISH